MLPIDFFRIGFLGVFGSLLCFVGTVGIKSFVYRRDEPQQPALFCRLGLPGFILIVIGVTCILHAIIPPDLGYLF